MREPSSLLTGSGNINKHLGHCSDVKDTVTHINLAAAGTKYRSVFDHSSQTSGSCYDQDRIKPLSSSAVYNMAFLSFVFSSRFSMVLKRS